MNMPKLVLVATCSPCNARCPHCPCTYKPEIRNTEDKYLKYEYFHKLVDEITNRDTRLRMSGYGEPLLHPRFYDMMKDAQTYGVKTSLITNGSLLDNEMADRILDAGLESVEVSVDSHIKDIYERIRVGLDFSKVFSNIVGLVEKRNKHKSKLVVMVSIINQPSKNPDIDGAVKYWEKVVDKVMLRKYVTWGILPTEDCASVQDKREACPYPFERLMVDPAGYYRLCPYDDQKLIPPLGHIKDNMLHEVWGGLRMDAIREGHNAGDFNNIELCGRCTDWAYRSWTHNYLNAIKDINENRPTMEFYGPY